DQNKDTSTSEDVASGDFSHLANDCRRRVQRETNRSQNHSYRSPSHRSAGYRPNGALMRPPLRSSGPRPHGDSMRPSFRPTGHRPHGPSMNPRRPTMNELHRKFTTDSTKNHTADMGRKGKAGSSQNNIDDKDSECIVLGRNFKLLDDTNILLRTPRQHNMYSIDLNNIIPLKDLTCLVAKASADECILWHRRLESDLEAHPEDDDDEDPKEDPVDYPADEGDDGDDEERSS
nr:ribonuclease H-like domain-containing protein [Tanacetum cinerariifolium]